MKTVQLGVGVVISACLIAAGVEVSHVHHESKLKSVTAQLRRVNVAVESVFVDDCGGLHPEFHDDLPTRLSTPIAYLKPADFTDPYGRRGETLLYIPEKYFTNVCDYLIVSRGPDGDLDASRLPKLLEFRRRVSLTLGTSYRTEEGHSITILPGSVDPEQPRENVVDYTTPDGVTHRNNGIKKYGLPPRTDDPNSSLRNSVDAFLSSQGVVQYDPTNGLLSDGDVIRYSR